MKKKKNLRRMRRLNHFTLFDAVVSVFMIAVAAVMLIPFLNVVSVSLSSNTAYIRNPAMILPSDMTLEAYRSVLSSKLIPSSYRNTIVVTLASTGLGMLLSILMAYPLSKPDLAGKKLIVGFLLVTMFFNGGLIANFYLVKRLGMFDTLWALIIPGSVSIGNIILLRNGFESVPRSLEESALLDGANDLQVLFRIVLPVCLPILATVTLFYAVGHWNAYFNAVVYINGRDKWTLQLMLREIIISRNLGLLTGSNVVDTAQESTQPQMIKCATLVVSMLPIMMVYPFLQRYFVRGLTLGAVKE